MTKVVASSHEHPDVVTVAVDTGGTFTDLVARVDGVLARIKTPSTPDDPAEAVVTALRQLQERHHLPAGRVVALRHDTTVATNALLERAGAKVVLITNSGFEDVIALRRQDRPDLYALHPVVPEPLVPASARVGIDVRRGPRGECWRRLEPVGPWIERHRELLAGAEAFAVSLLHAWRDGEDERAIGEALAAAFPDTPLTLSHALSPVFREYERTSTALVNAYVAPMMNAYLRRLAAAVAPATLFVQGSSGKLLTVEEVARAPARTVLSGPAGGVQGAWRAGQRVGADRLLALDMGGTSTDVSLIEGAPSAVDTGGVATHPVRLPLLPIETIGAGGAPSPGWTAVAS